MTRDAVTTTFDRMPRLALTGLLFALALALGVAGNGRVSLWDRDEPRFAEASRESIASGDWVVPRFNGKNRYDKPILIYWLMGAAMKALGPGSAAARLPAALAGAATTALIFRLALAMGCGLEGALLAAVIMMTSALSLAVSKAATTDSVLTLTVVAMMAIRWRARRRSDAWSWPFCLLFYAILAASTLLKGPPGPMIVGTAWACEAAWRRRARQPILDRPAGRWLIEHAAGWALFLALTLPWCILAWRRTDGEFFRVAFGHHVVERSVQALEHHGGDSPLTTFLFLFYYLAVLPIEFFPWTAPFLAGLRHGWRERASEPTRFLWSWTLPMLVIFSIVRTKLPHYMAPLLPAWALMAGQWWTADGRGKRAVDAFGVDRSSIDQAVRRWGNAGAILTGVLGLAAGLALAGTGFYLGYRPLIAPGLLTGLVMGGGAVAGAWRWLRGDARRAMAAWWLSAVAWTLLIYLWLLPAFEPARPAKPLTDWVRAHVPAGVELMAADYREPSFVFYWQGPVAMLGNAEPEAALARLRDATRPVALLIPATRWGKWKRELPSLASDAIPVLYRRRFYLLTQGRWDDMLVVGNRKAAASAGG